MSKVTQGNASSLRDNKHWQHMAQEADTDKSFPLNLYSLYKNHQGKPKGFSSL